MLIFEDMELKPADWKDPSALLQIALRSEPGAVQKLADENPFYRPARLLMGAMELAQGKEIHSPLALYFNAEERELLYRVKVMLSLSGRDHAPLIASPAAAPGTALLFPEMETPKEKSGYSDSSEKEIDSSYLTSPATEKEIAGKDLSRQESSFTNNTVDPSELAEDVSIPGEWSEYELENPADRSPATLQAPLANTSVEAISLSDESENELNGQTETEITESVSASSETSNETYHSGLHSFADWLKMSGSIGIRKPFPLPTLKPGQTEISENPSKEISKANRVPASANDLKALETGYLQEAVIAGLIDKEKSLTRDLEGFIDHQIRSKKKNRPAAEKTGDGLPITESMASILLSQGKKERAVAMYQALSLKFPEKSGYFAALIREIP